MASEELKELYQKKTTTYANSRPEMLTFAPAHCNKVLDVGCGEGNFAVTLKTQKNCEVWGVDINQPASDSAAHHLDKILCVDLTENMDVIPDNYFDVIYFNDVLEHLPNPARLLKDIRKKLVPNGVVIASIPNVRHFSVLLMLLRDKDFKYEQAGIMDETHLRFFTRKSIMRLFEESDYDINSLTPINASKSIRPKLMKLFTLGLIGNDISYLQYVVVASPHS
ncbi:bifunctional 2-polyprenyl-6-hydroxyphenol methylase/3-demethylubiquinol 3-O-methyltransferase UbiG [Aliikangiella sp. G2MR2-5]|uniref:class I SAM-dependent methyltransferase n=1 Tax=Aliikangiella sp. G2MR2-5 TaxID=2788943 RepID=UPI0018A8E531|nr:class I SAM-dependent methyltransferase [Aliikangiella sp. G2MR2-5]